MEPIANNRDSNKGCTTHITKLAVSVQYLSTTFLEEVNDKGFDRTCTIYDLENLPPSEYKVGHGMVAYVNQNEEFKVFYNGDIYNVLNYAPAYFDVKDSLIAFNNEGFLNVFFDGKSKQITRYIPPALEWDWSTLAYVDDNLKIQAFMAGKQEFIINETIRDIITIRYGNQSWAIYYGGKLYYMQDQ